MSALNAPTLRNAIGIVLLLTTLGHAEPCPPVGDSLVIAGSTAIKPLVRELAKVVLANEGTHIYYAGLGSCSGVELAVSGSPLTATTLSSWDVLGDESKCELDGESPRIDIGVSDVFPASCVALANGLPSNVGDFLGPVQAMVLAVPRTSTQTSISAEAAYYVYGFGADSGVTPWTDEARIFQRNEESGTQTMVGMAIGVPANRFRGTQTLGSSDLLERLVDMPMDSADAAIGILSASHAEQNRSTVRTLAYQDLGESCAILPNRTPHSNEKANVRDGSYPIWGPVHMLTTVDAQRRPSDPLAAQLIGYLTGALPPPGLLNLIAFHAEESVVPQCAMRVTRTHELGPPIPFIPEQPCGCAYDEVANGATDCEPCETSQQCAASQMCSFGYCEEF